MSKFKEFGEENRQYFQKVKEAGSKGGSGWEKTCIVGKMIGSWAYKLRSVLLSLPVLVAAIVMAVQNMARLPATVGINLLANGEYQFMVAKIVAVLGPLGVTAVCLLLMFCSRKVVYPWLISVFSLILPWFIWITNVFPA